MPTASFDDIVTPQASGTASFDDIVENTTPQKKKPSEEALASFPNPGVGAIAKSYLSAPATGLIHAPGEILDWAKRGGRNAGPSGGFMTEEPTSQMIGAAIGAVMPVDKGVSPLESRLGQISGKRVAGTGRVGPLLDDPVPAPKPEVSPAAATGKAGLTPTVAKFLIRHLLPGGKLATDAYDMAADAYGAWQGKPTPKYQVPMPPAPKPPVQVPPELAMGYKVAGPPAPRPAVPEQPQPAMAYRVPMPPVPRNAPAASTPSMRPPPIGRMRSAPEPEVAPDASIPAAPEPVQPNTVTSPATAAQPQLIDRPGISQMLHHAAAQIGIDHEMLSGMARRNFGVRSMTEMSEKQMLQLYSQVLSEQVPAVGPALNLKTTGKPTTVSLEEQLQRSLDLSKKRFLKGSRQIEPESPGSLEH